MRFVFLGAFGHAPPAPLPPCRALGQNLLRELPDEVSRLTCLQKLQLPSNLLKRVPVQLAGLSRLEWL